MRRDLVLKASLCLLVSVLAVAMATEENIWPGPLAVAVATEKKTGQGSLPIFANDQRQSSPKLGSENEQPITGSNSSVTAAGKGHIHVLLSSSDHEKHALKPSIPVSQDGRGQMPPDRSGEKKSSSITASPYDPDQDHSTGRLLVAVARTLVTSTASTTTLTVLSSCHNGAIPAACPTGRKRKLASFSTAISETGLDSSIESEPVLFDKPFKRAGRLILWSSSITTVLFTVTTSTALPVVTLAYSCSFVGMVVCPG